MLIYMPNKTIYVSKKDEALFNEAVEIAGEALSSVIAQALSDYVARAKEMVVGMKEISVKVGSKSSFSEKRFIGSEIGIWQGLSDDNEWLLKARIFLTKKDSIVILLSTVSKASLIKDPKEWKRSGDYLSSDTRSQLFVGKSVKEMQPGLPQALKNKVEDLIDQRVNKVEYLDI
jgi:EXLDI family protein